MGSQAEKTARRNRSRWMLEDSPSPQHHFSISDRCPASQTSADPTPPSPLRIPSENNAGSNFQHFALFFKELGNNENVDRGVS